VPRQGLVVANAAEAHVMEVIDMGCWTPVERFATSVQGDTAWYALAAPGSDFSEFAVMEGNARVVDVSWSLLGRHNAQNALAALLAARHAGVPIETGAAALKKFEGVRRRMEVRGVVNGVTVYDDFAHHPTAVETTIDGLRRRVGQSKLVAVLEPRSNTMKLGTHRDALAKSLAAADEVWMYQGPSVQWDVAGAVAPLGDRAQVMTDLDALIEYLATQAKSGDHILIMSNGGFGGIHEKLLNRLRRPPG
jgi:UDP-N-acetylmuramate: L-alanyl-gamma-D-glutamyl-meso-diaminopimelate ligase